MSDGNASSGGMDRNGPPPVPARAPSIPSLHSPPPVPVASVAGNRQPPPVPTQIVAPPPRFSEPPPIPARIAALRQPEVAPTITILVAAPTHHHPQILSRLALVLTILCIPLVIAGAYMPLGGAAFWMSALIFAFLALCLAKFALSNPEAPTALLKLTRQLSHGFIFIALIGLIVAAVRASIFLSGPLTEFSASLQASAEALKSSNSNISWFLTKIDAVIQFVTHHSAAAAAASPSPTPAPSP